MRKPFFRHGLKTLKLGSLLFISSLATTLLTGCFTVGQEFSASRVTDIKIGQTHKQDISDMLGRPWRTGLEDGHPTWTYGIYKYSMFGADDTQDLLIRFDNQGVVRSYNFSSTRK
jgi:outer membrane protein assembly factor BamE (lipoprotein component of BamABCDE complex)